MIGIDTRKLSLMVILFLFTVVSISSESEKTKNLLLEGMQHFGEERYNQSIVTFRNIILDSELEPYHGEAYFWIARSYIAINKLDEAERSLESFLLNFPDHQRYSEAYYQKGRLLYLQRNYEGTIQVLQSFLDRYSASPFISNAYYWIGESFYSLGYLEEAEKVFRKIVNDFPKSYKLEAAKYRISMIEFKKKEQELLKLLKWSHEESLKTVQEFQKREKTYEQALVAYQRKIASYETEDYEKKYRDLAEKLAFREEENDKFNKQLEELQKRIVSFEAREEGGEGIGILQATSLDELNAAKALVEKETRLLLVKEEALDLEEKILTWLEKNEEAR